MNRISRMFWLVCYYAFARYLPASNLRFTKWCRTIRRQLCCRIFKHAGRNINVERGAYFGTGTEIELGDNSGIGVNSRLIGPVKIGNNVMMGPEVLVLTRSHLFDRLDIPMILQGEGPIKPVTIGDDVWVGARVIILQGVEIGRGCIVGAGSVVTRSTPEYALVAGNPARVIKFRKDVC